MINSRGKLMVAIQTFRIKIMQDIGKTSNIDVLRCGEKCEGKFTWKKKDCKNLN